MSKTTLSSDLASPPGGPYSQIVIHNGLVYLAGCTPHTPGTGHLVDGDFITQARAAFGNVQALAATAGTSLDHALKVTVYLRDMADFAAMNALFAEYMGDQPPVRTTVPVDLPGFAIEIDATLALPTPS
ncbi:MAG: RidA family protein [Nostocoides sp.]